MSGSAAGKDKVEGFLELALMDAFGKGVDGADAGLAQGGLAAVLGDDLVEGVDHLEAQAAAFGLALHADAEAGMEAIGEVGLVEPDEIEATGVVGEGEFEAGGRTTSGADDARGGDFATCGAEAIGLE
jgi:hypothetical protein